MKFRKCVDLLWPELWNDLSLESVKDIMATAMQIAAEATADRLVCVIDEKDLTMIAKAIEVRASKGEKPCWIK